MVRAYYRARGWTDEGQVPDAVLAALDLSRGSPRGYLGPMPSAVPTHSSA